MKLKLGISFVTAAGIALMSSVAQSAPDDNSLVIAWGSTGPIEHVDNYVNTNRTGIWSVSYTHLTLPTNREV